ncbi:MAG: DUF917 family protein [Eggerthellaceae bacterium]
MRKIGIQEIEDIALGATLLGAGGGGDPYIGKLTAIGAVKECGEVELIGIDEVPDGAFIMPAASMGAPTLLAEKGVGANEFAKLFDMVSRYGSPSASAHRGRRRDPLPIAAAARSGFPVDVDGMGRRICLVVAIGGASAPWRSSTRRATPASSIPSRTSGPRTCPRRHHDHGRHADHRAVLHGRRHRKQYGVRHRDALRELGRAIERRRTGGCGGLTPGFFLKFTGGHKLFKGKISTCCADALGPTSAAWCWSIGIRTAAARRSSFPEREPQLRGGRPDQATVPTSSASWTPNHACSHRR